MIERSIGQLKQYRALETRYEKRVENYEAPWKIVSALEGVTELVES